MKAAFGFLSTTDLAQTKAQVKVYLNPMSKPMVQLSVTNFHLLNLVQLNMFCWCEWGFSYYIFYPLKTTGRLSKAHIFSIFNQRTF